MGIVEAREIKKYYGSGEARVKALTELLCQLKKEICRDCRFVRQWENYFAQYDWRSGCT